MSEDKKILMSHTAAQCWKQCPEKHYLRYKARISPKLEGASLRFGIAIDTAVSNLLTHKMLGREADGLAKFKEVFLTDEEHGWEKQFNNSQLRFSRNDYDGNVLTKEDQELIEAWEEELGVNSNDARKAEKQKDHRAMRENELTLFNRLCHRSLLRKGLLMLDAFVKEILPKIKKVIAIQHKLEGNVEDIARVGGYIDLICELEGYDKPVVLDLKTSSSFYDSNAIMFSEQLHLYLSAVGDELNTDLAGFVVLLKFMKLKETCSVCGFEKNSKHRTCNFEKNGVRCNGEWTGIPEGQTQLLVEKISKERRERFMQGFSSLAVLASQDCRVQDWDRCFDYGMCEYFHLCHYSDRSKYTFPEDKKNEEEEKINDQD